jgi:hypothetical protein
MPGSGARRPVSVSQNALDRYFRLRNGGPAEFFGRKRLLGRCPRGSFKGLVQRGTRVH